MLPGDLVAKQIEAGVIEIAPLAFMRGRTLAHAFVILDEAQNASPQQMMMFLTRFGEGSRMVVAGDPDQVDLPLGTHSGLADAATRLVDVPEIGFQHFTADDVVRDPLVGRIVRAYGPRSAISTTPKLPSKPAGLALATSVVTEIDVSIEVDGWQKDLDDPEALVRRAAEAVLASEAADHIAGCSIAVLLGNDTMLAELNQQFRGIDKPTNVLAFPDDGSSQSPMQSIRHLGDIAVSYETLIREIDEQEKTLHDHLTHMIVHGVLHLLGYDHLEDAERQIMETTERTVLASLGVPDPYDP